MNKFDDCSKHPNLAKVRQYSRKKRYEKLCKINLEAHKKLLILEKKKDKLTENQYESILLDNKRVIEEVDPKIKILEKIIREVDNINKKHLESENARKKEESELEREKKKLFLPEIKKQKKLELYEFNIIHEKIKELKKLYKLNLIDKSKYKRDLNPLTKERKRLKTKIKKKHTKIKEIESL